MSTRTARRRREAALGYLMISPALVLFGIFVFYPFVKNFQTALYLNPPFPGLPKRYVGFQQFSDILGSDDFTNSLKVTLEFALLTVPAGIGLGLLLAVAGHRKLRGVGIYRTIFSSTVATSVAVAAVIFSMLFNPIVGLLPWLGIDPKPPVIENPDLALLAVAVVTIWQTLGLTFILLSAGLQGIPEELNEAAQVDGAGPTTRFWRITIPMLSPTLFFAFIVGTIPAFQSFGQIDILTGGGPFKRTNVLTYSIVSALSSKDQAADSGRAAVLAIALFVITLGFTTVQMRTLERRVHYAR